MSESDGPLDLLIVGAGIYGIYAANTYLTLFPKANIKVLDSDSDAGGTWSTSRLYPKFWSQTGVRVSGFPDVPFKLPPDAETYHDLFEAKHLAQYLESYVTGNVHDGRSLRERFVFNCWVSSVRKDEGKRVWVIEAAVGKKNAVFEAKTVIIATGRTSVPNMPDLPGKESLKGTILHQKDFGKSSIMTESEREKDEHTHITILGGSKSAADIAYAAATDTLAPRKINWIIRRTGSGPLLLTNAKGFGKYHNLPETGSTRAVANLSSANPFLPESWWSWFLHKTPLGDWLLQSLWQKTEKASAALANYDGREGALPGFESLRADSQIRWRIGPVGILQNDEFWDVVARNVRVYRKDVARLEVDAVVLEDGTKVRTDVLFCATGWTQEHPYFSAEEAVRLGLPVSVENDDLVEKDRAQWSELEADADKQVLERWPYLANVPHGKPRLARKTPYRLYNVIVPVEDPSIVFLGQVPVPNSYHTSVAQTLYAIACLIGALKLPSQEETKQRIAFMSRWCARRYPATGALGNNVEFEMVSYTDHLLNELGLSSHRSPDSSWKDLTDPCLASDYAGLVDEFRKKYVDKE